MIYVENMILSVIIILFPLLVFFVFLGYNQNNDKAQDELLFQLSLFTSAVYSNNLLVSSGSVIVIFGSFTQRCIFCFTAWS